MPVSSPIQLEYSSCSWYWCIVQCDINIFGNVMSGEFNETIAYTHISDDKYLPTGVPLTLSLINLTCVTEAIYREIILISVSYTLK